MDLNDLHPADDYSHRFFIWHEWIQANGPLSSENVFDYFATSMFYDKQSNNQVLRMQTMHTGVPIKDEAAELRRFTGIEFAVVHAQPPTFFIIQKRERLSPDEVRPLSAYFITNNRIYQSPDLYTVLSNRLLTAVTALQSSLDVLRKNRPDYTPRTGFVWPITDPALSSQEDANKKKDSEIGPSIEQEPSIPGVPLQERRLDLPKRTQNNMLLMNAMAATAAHSKMSFTSSLAQAAESNPPDTPATTTIRSSPTPGPQDLSAKSSMTSIPAEGGKTQKKKKKRASLAPNAQPADESSNR